MQYHSNIKNTFTKSKFLLFGILIGGCVAVSAATPPGETPITVPPFVQDDQIISDPAISIIDPEIDTINNRVAWKDLQGNLWLSTIDPKTAELIPVSGQGELIDIDLAPINQVFQGPEWAHGSDGIEIVYTRVVNGKYHLSAARQTTGGEWQTRLLQGGESRYTAYATPSWNEQGPAITVYRGLDTNGKQFQWWREIKQPTSERKVYQPTAKQPYFIEGENA